MWLTRIRHITDNVIGRGTIIGMLMGFLCWLLNSVGPSGDSPPMLQGWNDAALDASFQFRGVRPMNEKVCIIAIDEDYLVSFDKPLVYLSPDLARAMEIAVEQGAVAIGIDALVHHGAAKLDALQTGAIGDVGAVGDFLYTEDYRSAVLPVERLDNDQISRPPAGWFADQEDPDWRRWNTLGYVNLTPDADMTVRRQQLAASLPVLQETPSLGLALAGAALGVDELPLPGASPTIAGQRAPALRRLCQKELRINFAGPPGTIPYLLISELLGDAPTDPAVLKDLLEGAVVLIGFTAPSMHDLAATPYASGPTLMSLSPASWWSNKRKMMPGVEIHANVVSTLLDGALVRTPGPVTTLALFLAMGIALAIALMHLTLEWGLLLTLVHHFAWKCIVLAAFAISDWHLDAAGVLLLAPLLYAAVFALRWRWMRRSLGLFKSEAVARLAESSPGSLNLRGEERVVTVLFSDVRGFTNFSEGHSPREVFSLLNAYFSVVVPVVEKHGGIVNQYMGDGMMVLFGAPAALDKHPESAVRAAIEMLNRVHDQQSQWTALGAADFRIGIGIHTGEVVAGTIGSRARLDYTAIGDTVNTSSRIESATKEVGQEILVSQATVDRLPQSLHESLGILPEPIRVSVKGKSEPLVVYAVKPKSRPLVARTTVN